MSTNFRNRFFTSIILFLLIYLIFVYNFILIYSLLIIGVISLLEFFRATKRVYKNNLTKLFCNILFSVYTFLLCFFFLTFSIYFNMKVVIFIILFVYCFRYRRLLVWKNIQGSKINKYQSKKNCFWINRIS